MTVLVTGASGLIGRHTVRLLVERGEAVRTFQRAAPDGTAHTAPHTASEAKPESRARVEHVSGDIRSDVDALCRAATGCRAIVHLAGRGDVEESRRDPLGYARLNATGALHALQAARAANALLVLASSQRVYPLQPQSCAETSNLAPDSPYGYAKWVAELWCRMTSEQFGVTTRVLRFFSVYGPGQQANGGSGVVTIFLRAALNNQPLTVQSAGKRDFTDVRDVARGIAQAVEQPADGQHRVYNVATGTGTTFAQLAALVKDLSGSASPIEERIAEPAGRDLVADISRARHELGYTPCVTLRDGLQQYIEWLTQNSA